MISSIEMKIVTGYKTREAPTGTVNNSIGVEQQLVK
jgi:hypothetical protein